MRDEVSWNLEGNFIESSHRVHTTAVQLLSETELRTVAVTCRNCKVDLLKAPETRLAGYQ